MISNRRLTSLSMVAAAFALSACATSTSEPAGRTEGNTAEAQQALTQCITLQRGTLGTVEDAHIAYEPGKYGKNYGTSQGFSTGVVGGGSRQALLRFDLSPIPAGSTITSATVRLSVLLNGGVDDVDVREITSPWSETTVTYNSFSEAYSPTESAVLPGATAGNTTSADITSLVSGWYGGSVANYGVLLDQTGSGLTTYTASEHAVPSMRPALDVCYVVSPCLGQPDGTACDDNNTCTTADTCQAGVCVGGGADPCVNGACSASGPTYTCACDAGWTGANCDVDVNDCAGNPCAHGTCSDTGTNSYACACDPGWTGANCDVDVDECASGNPCNVGVPDPFLNAPQGAACVNTPGSYTCQCNPLFAGADCTTVCPCVGSAIPQGDFFTFILWAYTGLGLAPGNACTVNAAGDTTVDGAPGSGISLEANACSIYFQGTAFPSYPLTTTAQRDACRSVTDFAIAASSLTCTLPPCDTLTCQNGGTCTDFGSTGGCSCPAGWTGNVCEIPVATCSTIKAANPGATDGVYQLNTNGTPFEAYCDMTTDGGGWTLVFNDGTSFDKNAVGSLTTGGPDVNGTSYAYSAMPLVNDIMMDAKDGDIVGSNYLVRTIVSGVHSSGSTVKQMFTGGPSYIEAEDNSNVTNIFAPGGGCGLDPIEWSATVCGTSVITFGDGVFAIGISDSYTVGHGNGAGWPNDPNYGGATNYYPDNFRVWIR